MILFNAYIDQFELASNDIEEYEVLGGAGINDDSVPQDDGLDKPLIGKPESEHLPLSPWRDVPINQMFKIHR